MNIWSTGTAILIKSATDTTQNVRQKVSYRRASEGGATLYAWQDGTAQVVGDMADPLGSVHEKQHGTMEAAMHWLDTMDAK
jgi:hypothetical protein